MKKLILSLSVCSVLFAACTKDTNTTVTPGNTTLTTGSWMITASISDISYGGSIGTMTYDLYAALPACQQDNKNYFNANGTITTDENTVKCNSTDPQQFANGTWQLLNNNAQLQTVASGVTITSDILKLTSDSLVVHYNTNYGGYPASTTTRYVHIP